MCSSDLFVKYFFNSGFFQVKVILYAKKKKCSTDIVTDLISLELFRLLFNERLIPQDNATSMSQ